MTDNYIQWSKLLDLFLKYAHFEREREREKKSACFNYLHLFVPTNNETVNFVLLQKHVNYYCWKIIKLYFIKTLSQNILFLIVG